MGSFGRTRWPARPGPLVLGLGFGLQVASKRTNRVFHSRVQFCCFESDFKSSLGSRRLNIDCSYCSEQQEAVVARGTGLPNPRTSVPGTT